MIILFKKKESNLQMKILAYILHKKKNYDNQYAFML